MLKSLLFGLSNWTANNEQSNTYEQFWYFCYNYIELL